VITKEEMVRCFTETDCPKCRQNYDISGVCPVYMEIISRIESPAPEDNKVEVKRVSVTMSDIYGLVGAMQFSDKGLVGEEIKKSASYAAEWLKHMGVEVVDGGKPEKEVERG
jgi:hypothetical protein